MVYEMVPMDTLKAIFMFAPCINSIKQLLLFQLMHTIIKNYKMLKQFKSYNTCSNTFLFTQEPSSGSSPVLSQNYKVWFLCPCRTQKNHTL